MKVSFNSAISKFATNFPSINESPIMVNPQLTMQNLTNLTDIRALIGQSQINFYGNNGLTPQVSRLLEMESTKRIRGDYKWPEIRDIKGLMISAETQTFMKVGGLAEVAVQLPNEFNKKLAGTPNKMQIMTPLYSQRKDANLSLTKDENGYYTYKKDKTEIKLEKVAEFPVETFDKQQQKYKTENVGVLVGKLNDSKYVFLQNDKYFDVTPDGEEMPNGPYVTAENKVTCNERMIFFSKAIYQLLKNNTKAPIKGFETPNVIVANDWHISPLSLMMRNLAPVENADGRMDSDTYDYFKKTPVIHITHNATYIGSADDYDNSLIKMALGEDADTIVPKAIGYMGKDSTLYNTRGEYCAGLSDTYNADRIVAVSPHYGDEISTSRIMSENQNVIHRLRQNYGTMLGIINGYTKALSEPNEKMIDKINSTLKPEKPFVPFANMYNDEGYKIKMENKARAIALLNSLSDKASVADTKLSSFEKEATAEYERGVYKDKVEKLKAFDKLQTKIEDKGKELYNDFAPGVTRLVMPNESHIELPEDISKIPFIASVGRITEQKGFDILIASIKNIVENLKPDEERPIIGILGSGDREIIRQLKELKCEIAQTDPVAASRIFVFSGFSSGLRDALGVGSDFFLIPSKWEPCGLTQMESMPKGSIPVATSTGGLVDTITDGEEGFLTDVFYAAQKDPKTGEVTTEKIFDNGNISANNLPANNIEAFSRTLRRALDTYYSDPEKIKQMAINDMAKDFSWNVPNGPLEDYIKLMRTGSIT